LIQRGFRLAALLLLALAALAGPVRAQGERPLTVASAGAAAGWRPVVRAQGLLGDPGLRDALRSGLPLRIRFDYEAVIRTQGKGAEFRLRTGDVVVVE